MPLPRTLLQPFSPWSSISVFRQVEAILRMWSVSSRCHHLLIHRTGIQPSSHALQNRLLPVLCVREHAVAPGPTGTGKHPQLWAHGLVSHLQLRQHQLPL